VSNTYPATKLIADITINQRHRRDLGDVASLATNIAEIGLLHPVVITPDGVLIAGARRIEACKQLGWTEVPVRVVDLTEIVKGEYAENAHRKDFLPTEINAIHKAMESVEKAAAQERMKEGGGDQRSPDRVGKVSTPGRAGKTRDKIGQFAGVSGKTVDKIAVVMKAAKANPKEYGHLPEQMDRAGKVDGAYRQVITGADAPIRLTPEQKLLALLDREDGADLLISALRKRPKLANEIADDVAMLKYVETPRPPLADLKPTAAPDVASIVPENAPPTASKEQGNHRNGRAPSAEMPDLIPGLDRRGGRDPWAKPSFAPEALQEMLDAGVDPDEAAELIEQERNRWA